MTVIQWECKITICLKFAGSTSPFSCELLVLPEMPLGNRTHIQRIASTSVQSYTAFMLLIGRQEGHPSCKNWVVGCWHGCLERGADSHMAHLMPLPLTVFCFSKNQIGFPILVLPHPGSSGQRAVKWLCVCVVQNAKESHRLKLWRLLNLDFF